MPHPEVPTPQTIQSMLAMLGIVVDEDDPRLAAIGRELETQTRFAGLIDAVLAGANIPAEAVANAVERFDPAWPPAAPSAPEVAS